MRLTESSENLGRLVVVSNRLPVVLSREQDSGAWRVSPGSGGLVTALAPVLKDRGGLWIGWPGTGDEDAVSFLRDHSSPESVGYTLRPVPLEQREEDLYYKGFSNGVIWPLFHDLLMRASFDPECFRAYEEVNDKFARVIAEFTREEDYIWVQDYHLMLVAAALQRMGLRRRTGFFLHIPFPSLDIFTKLPWRFQVLKGLLSYDLIGFQTARDRRNFVQCVRALMPGSKCAGSRSVSTLTTPERELRVGSFPIGIDARRFMGEARSKEVADRAWFIHEALPERKLVLGIDRLDYTKGIPQRIMAVGDALRRYPDLRGKITFIQVVVPSREDVPEYRQLRREVERLVGQINGQFTMSGWTPIHYIYRPLTREELLSYYRTTEIALITPLKDGMNLIAKEYCACSVDDGVLVLSEFAGAAAQLQTGALLVNPHDIEGTADALARAYHMDRDERRARMRRLRRKVARQDVFKWVDAFLRAAISKDLSAFPAVEPFVPREALDDERGLG